MSVCLDNMNTYHTRKISYIVGAFAFLASSLVAHGETPKTPAPVNQLAERGQYLAIVGDCAACHTEPGSEKPFAGGYPIHSPLGKIFSTNITPSKRFGIGEYSRDDFANALQKGIRKDGSHLYPAMPYTSYATLTPSDVDALYAYFMQSVKPVEAAPAKTALSFPFSLRQSMFGWNMLFNNLKPFRDDSGQSEQINRGRYLVDGLAHCSACHTPRNALMATKSEGMTGGFVGSWFAPNITNDKPSGIGSWSDEELFSYLKTGKAGNKSRAAGPMAEAIENSFQYMTDADIRAMVAYLRYLPSVHSTDQKRTNFDYGLATVYASSVQGERPMAHQIKGMDGANLFMAACASCHQPNGAGTSDGVYPSLLHNTTTGMPDPTNLIAAILFGVQRHVGDSEVKMPGFGEDSLVQRLNDDEVSAVANYVLQQFGNAEVHVTSSDVAVVRQGGPTAAIAKLGNPWVFWPLCVLGTAILALLIRAYRRMRRRTS